MALYLVVHHRQDTHQPWPNSWHDDSCLEAITTTAEIGRLCTEAQQKNERVFVHRCAWGPSSPIVCCSVSVVQVASVDRRTSLVQFAAPIVLHEVPPIPPRLGQNFYIA
jgi:hypothetical protein